MKKLLIILLLIILTAQAKAQNNSEIIKVENSKENKLYSIQNEGWTILEFDNGNRTLANLSHKDYILYFAIKCKEKNSEPKYLIEYNDNYRDGEWGGLDYISSTRNHFKKTIISVDKKSFGDPFTNYNEGNFKKFLTALQNGKLLSMKFYDDEFNPNTGKDELKLNREIQFQLKNSHLMEIPTDCEEEDTSEVPITEVLSSEAINAE